MASSNSGRAIKRKRVVLSLKDKLDIINRLDHGEKAALLAREYNVGKSSVMDIKTSRNSLLNFVSSLENSAVVTKRKTMKCAYNKELDKAVYAWYLNVKKSGLPIPGPLICDKALQLNVELGGSPDFKASGGWLNNFKYRHGLDFPLNDNDTIILPASLTNPLSQFKKPAQSFYLGSETSSLENSLNGNSVINDATPAHSSDSQSNYGSFSIPSTPKTKRKHVVLSLQQKLDIIQRLENGEVASNLAREYNVGKSTVNDIKKTQDALLEYVSTCITPDTMQKRRTMKCAYNRNVDNAVYKWYVEIIESGQTVTGPQICDKALKFNQILGGPSDFKASSGWLQNFKSRHGFILRGGESSHFCYNNSNDLYPDIYFEGGKTVSSLELNNANSFQGCESIPSCDVIIKESDECFQLERTINDSCDLSKPVTPEVLQAMDTVLDWSKHQEECTATDIDVLIKLRDLACEKGMSVAFSSDGAETISRTLENSSVESRDESFSIEDMYEIKRCSEWIKINNFSKVALQFPDSLLSDASAVALKLEEATGSQVYVLGDTSFGSCCVDEIAAEHVYANSIIHFGHACLSPTTRLPNLFVFGKQVINPQDVADGFTNVFPDKEVYVILICEVMYAFSIGAITDALKEYKNLVVSKLEIPGNSESNLGIEENYTISKCHRTIEIPKNKKLSDYKIFYIGSRTVTLTNFMLSLKDCFFYSYNPVKKLARAETLDVNKHLKRRYYYIEKAKDAKIIGLLVGTLGVANYLGIIKHLKELIKHAGKKSYTLVVGKLNNAKLANFSEIEVFVNVACVESSLIESRDFYQSIVTPHELELALNQAREWTGDYITDFSEILPGAVSYVPLSQEGKFESDVSLITGKLRHSTNTVDYPDENDLMTSLAVRDKMKLSTIHNHGAGEFLSERSWQGLEQNLGNTPVGIIEEGLKGIASQYESEEGNICEKNI